MAAVPDAPAPGRRMARARGIGVDQFMENTDKYISASDRRQGIPDGPLDTVDFYRVKEDAPKSFKSSFYCTMMEYAFLDTTERDQMCAYVLSAINVWFPMEGTITQLLQGLGLNIETREYPDAAGGIEFSPALPWRSVLLSFAQLIMILFKNISDVNYNDYMTKRIRAIRSFIAEEESTVTTLAVTLEKAKRIRRLLGGDSMLRKEVLEYILVGKEDKAIYGRMCFYLSGILAWTEMTYMVFMYEELILPSSPILGVKEIANEVRNLAWAICAVLRINHPQYYKILVPLSEQKSVDRNRFPTLIEVSRKLREMKSTSAQNFQGSYNIGAEVVNRLIFVHRGQPNIPSQVYARPHAFLTGTLAAVDGYAGLLNDYAGEA